MVSAPNSKSSQQPTATAAHGRKPSKKAIAIAAIIIALAGIGTYFLFFAPRTPKNVLQVSGRVEGYETNLGPKIGGRVDVIHHREGEEVKKGELLIQISDADIQAQLRGTIARINRAQQQVDQNQYQLQVIQTQIDESALKVAQTVEDSSGKVRQWEATVASDQAKVAEEAAALDQAKADLELAVIRRDRYAFLYSKLAVTKDEYDQAVTTYNTNKALVESRLASVVAQKKVLRADLGQLTQAKATRIETPMQSQVLLGYKKQLLQAQHAVKSALADVANAKADRDQTLANLAYLRIESPINGVVTARAVEPGAVVTPGQTLMSLIDLNNVYLRAYVPEGQIGHVHVGQNARIFLDSFPNSPLEGKVIQVDPQGSFTPENIYFKNDRVKQVFGIKIAIFQKEWYAKPGMPADAEITFD